MQEVQIYDRQRHPGRGDRKRQTEQARETRRQKHINQVVQTIRNLKPLAIASGAEGTWVIEGGPHASVTRLGPGNEPVAQRVHVPALSLSGSIALGAGAVWLTDPNAGQLWRIDPTPTPVERSIRLAPGVSAVAQSNVAFVRSSSGLLSGPRRPAMLLRPRGCRAAEGT